MLESKTLFALASKTYGILSYWHLLAGLAALFSVFWWRRCHPEFPPGPRGVPFFGVIPFLGALPFKTIKKWSVEKYGPVMSIRLGREEAVVLNTYDAMHQAFVKQNASFSDRPWFEMFRVIGNEGIVSARYDEAFKVQKQFGLKFMREKHKGKKSVEALVNEEGDNLVDFLRQYEGKPVDLKKHLYWLTSNVISKTALGRRYDYYDPAFHEVLDVLERLFNDPHDAPYLKVVNMFPFTAKLPPFSAAMKQMDEREFKILDKMQMNIDEHRKNFDRNNINDFVDAFIFEQKFGKQNESFTDRQFCIYCHDLLVAGSETSSSTLAWCFVFLLNYPESYKIIEKEIEDCLGEAGVPSMTHREKMPYTCAFIQEMMRVKALSPMGVAHLTSETTRLMGYVIPKGTKVFPNIQGVHLDPVDWPDPDAFDPRRHIDEDGKFVASKKIIPFSIGSRFCLGESLARVEIFIFLVKLIQKFRVRSAKSYLPPMDREIFSVVLCPRECEVIMEAKR